MSASPKLFDAAIIGGGPAGLSAALALSRVQRSVILFDSQTYRNASSKYVHNIFGQDGIENSQLRKQARAQIEAYKTTDFIFDTVTSVARKNENFQVVSARGASYMARTVLLATGVRDVMPPSIQGAQQLWDLGLITHCIYCHGYERRGRSLAILPQDLPEQPEAIRFMLDHSAVIARTLHRSITILTHGFDIADLDTMKARIKDQDPTLTFKIDTRRIRSMARVSEDSEAIEFTFDDGRVIQYETVMALPASKVYSPLLLSPVKAPEPMVAHEIIKPEDASGRTKVQGVYVAGDITTPMRSIGVASLGGAMAGVAIHADLAMPA